MSDYERGRAVALAEVMAMLRDMRAREAAVIAYWRTRGGEDGHVFKLCDRQLTLMTLMSLIDALKDLGNGARSERESWAWQTVTTDTERWVIRDGLDVIADVEHVDELYPTGMWHARVWDRGVPRSENRRARAFQAFRDLEDAKRACERILDEG